MVCGVCILRNGQRGPSRAVYALDSPAAQPMRKLHVDFDFFFPHKLKFYMDTIIASSIHLYFFMKFHALIVFIF